MKIPKVLIDKYKSDWHYEDIREKDWNNIDWKLDNRPYYKHKDCFVMHNGYRTYLEVPVDDIVQILKHNER